MQLEAVLEGLGQLEAVPSALLGILRKSGSDAVRFLRTGSNRLIRQRKRFKASTLNKAMTLGFPSRAASIDALVWTMDVSGKPVPLVEFPHSQTQRGVSVGINVSKRTLIQSAFIATMQSGHTGVFERVSSKRLPITELYSTKVTDVFQDHDFVPFLYQGAIAKFEQTFERLYAVEMKRAAGLGARIGFQ